MPFFSSRRYDLTTDLRVKRAWRLSLASILYLMMSGCASVDAQRRIEVDFEYVSNLAQELAKNEYRPPAPLPEALRELDYDGYRKIHFNNDNYLWKGEGLPFALGFFHPGFLYSDRIRVNEFTPTHVQHIPYLKTFFEFEDKQLENSLPDSLDYSGVRLSFAVDEGRDYREIVSFLGASYFRGTGFNLRYGTSARGIAIDSGLGKPEEFPKFVEMWLGKPLGNARRLVMYALLDGPSLSGAYEFVIRPGEETVIDVRSRIFMRENVESFGMAPLTSMFWRGENRQSPEHDYRPEVHDSDGLIVMERDSEPLWRPFDLAEHTRLSYFGVDNFTGFGLMQRDRQFASYQDMEAEYHKRPSVWVETKGDWGAGFVKLVELPTQNEFDDNIVAFWEPSVLPEKGSVSEYQYSIHWTGAGAPEGYPATTVVSTRIGEDLSYPGTHVFVIDFQGTENGGVPPEPITAIAGPAELMDEQVVWNPYLNTWRVNLRLKGDAEDEGSAEIRCQLNFADGSASEIWAYQWTR